ncbi:MAG: mechanosensitive ion channel protein MscS [Verrucomicrobiales bacterium]|nr:mechanosensitive ion channel protein MscS [Verrucomicrobiales bacterium]
MTHEDDAYKVWAADNMIYGPIDFPMLVQWVQESRVLPETWVHSEKANAWHHANQIEVLQPYLEASASTESTPVQVGQILPEELRQFSVFVNLSNDLLQQFTHYGELCEVGPGATIIKKGTPGDSVYFILSGEVRARLIIGREDQTLNHIPAGQFFGEMSMFNQAPRSADVLAVKPTRLMRVSNQAFLQLIREVPALAAPFLFSMASMMAHRIAETNTNLQKQVASEFTWR